MSIYHPIIIIILISLFGSWELTPLCYQKTFNYKYKSQKHSGVKIFFINISGEISEEGILA